MKQQAAEKQELELEPIIHEPQQGQMVERQAHQVAARQAGTPMTMLQAALDRGMDAETLGRFMDLHQQWEKNEARKAYMEAIAAFKKDPPQVVKDALNKQYNSWYTSLGNMVNTVNESLGAHGLHAHWEFEQQNGAIKVTCILAHSLGHSEQVTLVAPPDTSGAKNPIQQIKSTTTYLKGATFEAVTGIASKDKAADDDGNSAGGEPDITDWLSAIDACATLEDLKKTFGEAYNENKSFKGSVKALTAAKDQKKRSLSNG